jgi:hypothetical protein
MAKIILDTDQALFEALGFAQQAELLLAAVRAQDPDTYEMTDAHNLLADAIAQLRGELSNRTEGAAA